MITCIIIMAISLALFILIVSTEDDVDKAVEASNLPFYVFIITLVITIASCSSAKTNKMIYNDMAKNPQCYSINDLKEAHKDILKHKVRQGHWTSFYNGYEFPEINVNVMDEVDTTLHIVK